MLWQRMLWVVGYAVILSVFILPITEAQQPIPGTAEGIGQRYFQQYCSACHGLDGRGTGPAAAALKTPPADLTRIAQRRGGHFPEADIAAIIDGRTLVGAHGSREMPVWGQTFGDRFGGGTVGDEAVRGHLLILINYLQSMQQ